MAVPEAGTASGSGGHDVRNQNERDMRMSIKLKVFGLGLLATMAMGAFAVMNATATTGGHFVSSVAHTTIVGNENSTHQLELTLSGLEGGIVCDEASYAGTTTNATETQIDITPSYAKCHTTTGEPGSVVVKPNGCIYRFTVAPGDPATTENTVDLVCPAGVSLEIVHPSCTIAIASQNNLKSVTYTTVVESGVHAITLHANASFAVGFEGGVCKLLGTNHTGALKGSATVKGFDTLGNPVGITST